MSQKISKTGPDFKRLINFKSLTGKMGQLSTIQTDLFAPVSRHPKYRTILACGHQPLQKELEFAKSQFVKGGEIIDAQIQLP